MKKEASVKKKPAKKEESEIEAESEAEVDEQEAEEDAEEDEADEDCEEENPEECEEDEEHKPTAKNYRDFWKALPYATAGVQNAVKELKGLHLRGGKQKKLAEMALGFAQKGWSHKLFKSIETLEEERTKSKNTTALPRVLMRTKCGGEADFQQASLSTRV